jgi:general secretion pathway protein D
LKSGHYQIFSDKRYFSFVYLKNWRFQMRRLLLFWLTVLFIISTEIDAQQVKKMDFRNQKIPDVLMVLADVSGQSIVVDQGVTGTVTFHFGDSDFESALKAFTAACNLFYKKTGNTYYVSRVFVEMKGESGKLSVRAEDIDLETLVKALSREVGKTIIYDPLPKDQISLNESDSTLFDVLSLAVKKFPTIGIVQENGGFYLKKTDVGTIAGGRPVSIKIKKDGADTYAIEVPKGSFSAVLDQLFKTGGREYSMLQKSDVTVENLYFSGKTFDQLLRILLDQGSCDFVVRDGIYNIFAIQQRDILKKLNEIAVIQLNNISVADVVNVFPGEYNVSSFLKADKATNTVYLSGSSEQIAPLRDFLERIDVPAEGRYYATFSPRFIAVKDLIAILPPSMVSGTAITVPGTNSFVMQVNDTVKQSLDDYILLVDRKKGWRTVYLRYIQCDDLVKNLPPSASKDDIVATSNQNVFFYTGGDEKYRQFADDLKILDKPKQQIRYQMLIVQYQKSDNVNWTKSLSLENSDNSPATTLTTNLSNLFDLSFDVVSKFGYAFAAKLSYEIGENRAKILADTTLNGLSGESIQFENTSTYRYTDTAIDADSGLYTGTTREITSGIVLKISGWVSGDDMITMSVDAQVSKQGDSDSDSSSSTTNPPTTYEKSVTTKVRTKSGLSIVIGGLMQIDRSESIKRLPVLGRIPGLGKLFQDVTKSEETTELVIYITPYLHSNDGAQTDSDKNIESYYQRYVADKGIETP